MAITAPRGRHAPALGITTLPTGMLPHRQGRSSLKHDGYSITSSARASRVGASASSRSDQPECEPHEYNRRSDLNPRKASELPEHNSGVQPVPAPELFFGGLAFVPVVAMNEDFTSRASGRPCSVQKILPRPASTVPSGRRMPVRQAGHSFLHFPKSAGTVSWLLPLTEDQERPVRNHCRKGSK